MQVTVFDRQTYKITSRKITDEGFLRVPGRAAKAGIQEYLACELGIKDRNPMDVIKVMRPEEEVFNDESLASYIGADITIEHPEKFVDAADYSKLSKGPVLAAVRDGDFVKIDMIVKSQDAIEAINSGKVELSAGYTANYEPAPERSGYDFIQRNIRINHVALVDRARAGAQARLFDKQTINPEKTMKKVVLDSGRSVELEDGATATLIQDSFDRLTKQATDSAKELETVKATSDAQAEKITKLEADLKAATDSDALKAKLAELAQVKDSAVKIAGKSFTCDSVDAMEIKRAALSQVRDSIDWAKKSDEYVSAAFDFADAEMNKEEDEDEEEGMKKSTDSQRRQLAQDAARQPQKTVDQALRRKFIDANRYKVTTGELTMEQLNAQADKIGG
jgi:hypothetical protein